MKILLNQDIIGIRNRGLENESKKIYAHAGDRVVVIFDNTKSIENAIYAGHFICEYNWETFVVFPSQMERIIFESKDNDLLYSESDEDIEQDLF